MYDIQIHAKIFIGSQREEFNLIFDSGSAWVWVGSENCSNCARGQNKFSHSKSLSYKQRAQYLSTLKYGRGQVWGYDSTDQVCLNKESVIGNGCMADYLFKTVIKQKDLAGLGSSGIIGLAPSQGWEDAQMFVPSLFKSGAIKKNVFAMFIDQNEGSSTMQIGGYDLKKYARGPLRWHKINSPHWWQLKFDDVRVGDFTFKPSTDDIIVDSGASLNILPTSDYNAIVNHFLANKNC